MRDKQLLVDTIRKKLKKGDPAGELEQELLDLGYSKEEVIDLMDFAATGTAKQKERPNDDRNAPLSLAAACCLILGITLKAMEDHFSVWPNGLIITGILLIIPAAVKWIEPRLERRG